MNKSLVLSYKPSKRNGFLCRWIHNIKLHIDLIFHVSFSISGPPFIAHPAPETDISGWIFKVDINFLLGIFLSLMCLTAEITGKVPYFYALSGFLWYYYLFHFSF